VPGLGRQYIGDVIRQDPGGHDFRALLKTVFYRPARADCSARK
jgi:hypothetical protein